jgi:hypothetical protein
MTCTDVGCVDEVCGVVRRRTDEDGLARDGTCKLNEKSRKGHAVLREFKFVEVKYQCRR